MTTWQEFYNQIKDPSWPECATEDKFDTLPNKIQVECRERFHYIPGSFARATKLAHKAFPIKSETACQLKWNWSTVYLTTDETASCHRTTGHKFDTDTFNFHNTPTKIDDRQRMLRGEWPARGCEYCKNIETAGGASDRITNLDFPGVHAPAELDVNPEAVEVTPRILEVYFDNTCNLKCVYCGPHFSSLWDAENKKHGKFIKGSLIISDDFIKSPHLENNKEKLFAWLRKHGHNLTVFNILGGEPLYQAELEQCLDLFEQHPAPELQLQFFTNLNTKLPHLKRVINRIHALVQKGCLRELEITASLDCWGPEQEYVRYPLNLTSWQENFEYLISQPWINLVINSTVTPLTVKTLPDLLERINQWSTIRPIYHYQNSVSNPGHMLIDIFGDLFCKDFDRALALKPTNTPEQRSSREYLAGIAGQANSKQTNIAEIQRLFDYLNELDRRRTTDWSKTFPWLIDEFAKYKLTI